jgi:branched-subunit amino acid transport protein AzlD
MERKKFFSAFGVGIVGIVLTKIFPFSMFKNNGKDTKKIKVKINPLAVKRQKIGGKNV